MRTFATAVVCVLCCFLVGTPAAAQEASDDEPSQESEEVTDESDSSDGGRRMAEEVRNRTIVSGIGARAGGSGTDVRFEVVQVVGMGQLSMENVSKSLRDASGETDACFERAAKTLGDISGTLQVQLTIDTEGQVKRARVIEKAQGGIERCLEKAIARREFRKPQGASVTVQVEYTYEVEGSESSGKTKAGDEDGKVKAFDGTDGLKARADADDGSASISDLTEGVADPDQSEEKKWDVEVEVENVESDDLAEDDLKRVRTMLESEVDEIRTCLEPDVQERGDWLPSMAMLDARLELGQGGRFNVVTLVADRFSSTASQCLTKRLEGLRLRGVDADGTIVSVRFEYRVSSAQK